MKLLPLFISSLSVSLRSANALWPVPRNLEKGTSHLLLSPSFDIQVEGVAFSDVPGDLQGAIGRTKTRLWEDRLGRLVPGRGQSDLQASAAPGSLSLLTLSIKPPPGEGKGAKVPSITSEVLKDVSARDESYSLHVPADGAPARISANSSLGLLRGLGTFEQLWYWAEKGGEAGTGVVYMHEAPVVVKDDRPAYPYRGFMLDTARNFFPVPDIKRTLDAMSMVKMSQFHWHVVDSQSFPLEVPEFPELAQKGAYSEKEKYSTQDVQDIVKYAAERGIDVLMEIDIPGHTAILAESHPEHIACLHASPWSQYANEPPAGQLRLASAATADFTVALISAIASRLPGTLFSTGGDEINQNCYREDAQTQKDLKESGKTLEQALDGFTGRVHEAVRGRGKRVVVWEEMALEHQVGLANDTVVMVWISSKNAAKVAKKGFHVVHAPSDYFYLDCGAGEWIGNSAGTNSWCDPFKSWQKAYTFDPLASLTKDQASLVLGGQQLLWAEQSSPENLDSIVWPRAAVSAEIFWTGPRLPSGASRSVGEALPRLHDIRFRMVQRGVKAIALQPLWCALRPGQCDS
ncbi:beta-hexosaminidase [Ephemerocybe angulata]|uniref:beta-N-acetylhexosaminidase n=1 Tax=Ephemerocybe angulata TaxID=980116 RepID=A0A8H6I0W1_9AGAR|nr:beta-hexosaminidase [Tulosesus angulatus]